MTRRRTIAMTMGCLLITALVVMANLPSGARQSLPWSATDIRMHYEDSGFPHYDYIRCLRARVTEQEFDAFADAMGLDHVYDPAKHASQPVGWGWIKQDWWTPPESLDGARVRLELDSDYFAVAKYEDGLLYFSEQLW